MAKIGKRTTRKIKMMANVVRSGQDLKSERGKLLENAWSVGLECDQILAETI